MRADLLPAAFARRLNDIEVHFTPEQEAQLVRIATESGTAPEALVRDAALHLVENDAHFRDAVYEGMAQADRGELIDEQEMNTVFEQMLRAS